MSPCRLPRPRRTPRSSSGRPRGWSGFGLAELWRYRELLYFLTKRELQVRYKQSVFGVAWAVLQPLALRGALHALLRRGQRAFHPTGFPYPVFALGGDGALDLRLAGAVGQSASSLVSDANLLTKVYFPRLLIPIARVLSFLRRPRHRAVVMLVVFIVLLRRPAVVGRSLLLPLFLLLAVVTALGVGVLFAAH